ncbi:hypothetical protein CASFOL_004965 [Castilleja foliolosa]|uniref:Replication protein A 70 kDa DNA-binding subunit B/D first OB fold domain-containing protein n=1 Tax=Castilleja foliolosa TaxID=1961234 RepID=A0ABD3E459_9LAMI
MAIFSLLSELHSGKTNWEIKARVVRVYKQPIFKLQEKIGTNEMVIHDSTGRRIQLR